MGGSRGTKPRLDWDDIEARLRDLAVRHIRLFAAAHPDETFCSFAFDCNGAYGDVILSFDTEWDHRRRRKAARAGEPYDDHPWETGAWSYVGHFPFETPERDAYEAELAPIAILVEEAFAAEPVEDGEDDLSSVMYVFVDVVTRILVSLERADVFAPLRRTNDFRVIAIDHDEEPPEALARLERFRRTRPARRRR